MHWFWRSTMALAAGSLFGLGTMTLIQWLMSQIQPPGGFGGRINMVAGVVSLFLLPQILVMFVYGLLTRRYYLARCADGETRCRKCGYILRGITEPRCPECGERI